MAFLPVDKFWNVWTPALITGIYEFTASEEDVRASTRIDLSCHALLSWGKEDADTAKHRSARSASRHAGSLFLASPLCVLLRITVFARVSNS
jgi:hypothetical protein